MAFKKTLFQRLFSVSRFPNPILAPKQPLKQSLIPPDLSKRSIAPDPVDSGFFKRILQRRPIYQASHASPATGLRSLPTGDKLIEKLRGLDIARDRIRLEGLIPPPMPAMTPEDKELTVSDVKKLMKASQLETIKAKLREIQKSWVSYNEFVEICKEGCYGDKERGAAMAKLLDDSGAVVVLGSAVCLRPDQEIKTLVAEAIQGLVPLPLNPKDPRRKELEDMEKQKLGIDRQADLLVRRELWAGLGYLMLQTAAFMRLTFWELSWDVMEPICFYVTSFYFMAGYGFFLRTSREPSFEGFFDSRFAAKQKKVMMARGFDVDRYNELRKACYPSLIRKDYYPSTLSSPSMATEKSFAL